MLTLLVLLLSGHWPPAPPIVTITPARPVQGSFVIIRARAATGDSSLAGLSGRFAGEALHFAPDTGGGFVAYAGVPVEARGPIEMPLVIERTGAPPDSMTVKVPVLAAKFGTEQLSVDPRFTNPPDSALAARISREAEAIRQAWQTAHETPRMWSEPFARPRASRITSPFGTARQFNGVVQSRHLGLDFDGSVGSTIRSANTGIVTLVGDFYYSGNIVVVNHGGGLATAYLHMSKVLVQPGDTVSRGQLLGLVGSTGRVTGPHLHWMVKYGAISINPSSILTVTAEPKKPVPARARPRAVAAPKQ